MIGEYFRKIDEAVKHDRRARELASSLFQLPCSIDGLGGELDHRLSQINALAGVALSLHDQTLRVEEVRGLPEVLRGFRMPVFTHPFEAVATGGIPAVVTNVPNNSWFVNYMGDEYSHIVILPVQGNGRTIGILAIWVAGVVHVSKDDPGIQAVSTALRWYMEERVQGIDRTEEMRLLPAYG